MNNSDVLICIFNYRHDDNAKQLLHMLSPYFETYVLDSGNDHEEPEFIQFPNIYYSGLFNEMKKLSEKKNYKIICQICSDVEIDNMNMKKLIDKIYVLLNDDDIGIWQPGVDKTSRKQWTIKPIMNIDNILIKATIIEGWMHIIKKDILNKIDYINTSKNLYGYGIDMNESFTSTKMGYLNIIDTNIRVHNPAGTGYSDQIAHQQGDEYIKSITGNCLNYHVKNYSVEQYTKTNF